MPALHAIVLAGGRARRVGGVDKVLTIVDGRALLVRAIEALTEADRVVVVGPPREIDLPRRVTWTREDPIYGGPTAGIAAGISALNPEPDDEILILPADLIHAEAVVTALIAPRSIAVDPGGRRQWACVRLHAGELITALAKIDDVAGLPLRLLLAQLDLAEVGVSHQDCADLDTLDDLKEYADEH